MPSDDAPKAPDPYVGCRMFVARDGLCGFALGTDGDQKGYLYDVFFSFRVREKVLYELMSLAISQGADKLVTYDDGELVRFFEQFGFQACAMVRARDAPPDWVPAACRSESNPIACPDFVYMIRVAAPSKAVTSWIEQASAPPAPADTFDSRRGPCPNCGLAVRCIERFSLFGAYSCARCGFLHACGTLTCGIRP